MNVLKYKNEIIHNLMELIRIPSISNETGEKDTPFGEECRKALEFTLSLGKKLGFRTKNIDGYCGYIEFGEGEELVGIIGHLDVVPAININEWTTLPFEPEIRNGKLYGRGAIDDKGPVITCLYAMKIVMDTFKVNKRIRLILGLNEEKSWKCIKYYKEHEESPTLGFSPDADFPCIYAEKGVMSIHIKENINKYKDNGFEIINIDCNSNALNVVPNYCKIKYKINNKDYEIEEHGISSHAAHPDKGENAISKALIKLVETLKANKIKIPMLLEKFTDLIGLQYNGENLKINFQDESGNLTLNVGNCKISNDYLDIGINLRVPVTHNLEEIEKIIVEEFLISKDNSKCIQDMLEIKVTSRMNSLYIEKDNELIKMLCDTFNEITGKNEEPIAIGGATYARAFKNCVSFGANFPGDKDMCHQVDEFIDIEKMMLSCQIYAEAIIKLAK